MEKIFDMTSCILCPRECKVNRESGEKGFCLNSSNIRAALASVHNFEEPSISGTKGSGTVFFSGCNMKCVFCQNYDISQENKGIEISANSLSETFLALQDKGVHNINLVSCSHFLPQIKKAITISRKNGLHIPIVYNSNGYEKTEALKELEGLIDIYLPDLKYFSKEKSIEYSNTPNYFEVATSAILEMYRQTGKNIFDNNGIMQKGVIIRHLVLPWLKDDSKKVLEWIKKNLGDNVYVSLLSQYTPMFKAKEIKELNRKITTYEYNNVADYFLEIGLKNGYVQQRNSASSRYTPNFNFSGLKKE